LNDDNISVAVRDKQKKISLTYESDLPGIYQTKNVLTVLQAVELLIEWKIKDAVEPALKNVKSLTGLHGRWELIHQNPTVVLEVAHNKEGVEQMLEHIKNLTFSKLHLITGMVKDKDIDSVLQLMPKEALYYFTEAHIPRALDAESLQQKATLFSLNGNHFNDVNIALQEALSAAQKDDLIIICGSIFLVAEVNRGFAGFKKD
jgi:dihydrofolate synthase/folylpolyglutamate synthase